MLEWLETLAAPVGWVVRAVVHHAKVRVELKRGPGGAMSLAGPTPELLTLRWHYTAVYTNLSKHDALEVEVIDTNNPELRPFPAHCIRALETISRELQFSTDVERATIRGGETDAADLDFWGRLLPPELAEARLVLSYKNDYGRTSYTAYRRQNGKDTNEYHIRKPRGAA